MKLIMFTLSLALGSAACAKRQDSSDSLDIRKTNSAEKNKNVTLVPFEIEWRLEAKILHATGSMLCVGHEDSLTGRMFLWAQKNPKDGCEKLSMPRDLAAKLENLDYSGLDSREFYVKDPNPYSLALKQATDVPFGYALNHPELGIVGFLGEREDRRGVRLISLCSNSIYYDKFGRHLDTSERCDLVLKDNHVGLTRHRKN
jgi:hypothetical protein